MRDRTFAGPLLILSVYVVIILLWLLLSGGSTIGALLFFLVGLPVVAVALWWSGRSIRPKR